MAKRKPPPNPSLSPHIDHIIKSDSSELRLKNALVTKFLFRFSNELILKIVKFVPDLYLVFFFLLNVPTVRFLEERIFIPGTRAIYINWHPTLDEYSLDNNAFENLIKHKKISIRFLDVFQFGCLELNRDNWQVPLFLFPFIVRYTNKEKTKTEIDDWNRIIKREDTQEQFLLNKYSMLIKNYKKKIKRFSIQQEESQQNFFKRIKNTNFQFTMKSMEQNSCFKNYQFTRLHLKTYYLYRGPRCLINLFNFKKLTKLTVDFLYPGYYIPNWKRIVPKLTALKYFTLNIGKLRRNDIGLILKIKSLVEFSVKTYVNQRLKTWQECIDKYRAKFGTDCPKISMKLINLP